MQERVTITERRDRNLEGGGVWQKTEAPCVQRKGKLFLWPCTSTARAPSAGGASQSGSCNTDGESTWKYPGVISQVRGGGGGHHVPLQLRNFHS